MVGSPHASSPHCRTTWRGTDWELLRLRKPAFNSATTPIPFERRTVAFAAAERIPPQGVKGFFQGAPDLAVEVISPTDRASEIAAKVQDWFQAGCSVAWVIDPEKRSVTVHRPDGEAAVLTASDTLAGDNVLAEFCVSVANVFG